MFVIVDNGSAHRGKASIKRLQGRYKNLILVHTPVHASWLNQAEIYFSIVQRKVLTPNDFPDLDTLEQQLLAFGRRYEQIATPFEWKFTRADLNRLAATTRPTHRPGSLTQIRRRTSEPEHLRVRERIEVTDLGDEPDRGQRLDTAQAAKPSDQRRPRTLHGLLNDQGIQAISPGEQHLVMGQISPKTTSRSGCWKRILPSHCR